ncbi:MAG: MBL fold metallo-hydrolase [Prevotella sp.]|nr:MBL fold metallo-hydrolase [Prevotella sp.]
MKNLFKTLFLGLALMMATTASAAQPSDTFTTPGGKTVTIYHIKHASIHIEYDGRHIYIDPVGTTIEPKTDVSLLPKAHIILITHEHMDHYDPMALPQMYMPATAVYANPTVSAKVHRGLALQNGDSIKFANDIKIWAVPAYNTTPGREQYHPKGRDNGYVLELDGLRIYIAGDTEDIPEMANLKDIDIAFLPCNQPYTMTIDQLERAANIIKPKVLFPYHYSETPINQVRMRMAGSDIDVRIRDYK